MEILETVLGHRNTTDSTRASSTSHMKLHCLVCQRHVCIDNEYLKIGVDVLVIGAGAIGLRSALTANDR